MKNIFLLALLWLPAIVPAFAQKMLPPSLQPYAENWTYPVVKAMHQAGFDMPTMSAAAATPTVQSRFNPLQLDSTKTFYAYDLNAPGDSTPFSRTIFRYPQPGVKTEAHFQYENGVWQQLSRTAYFYDEQQRLTEVLAEIFDATIQALRLDSRLTIFPHANSPVLVDSFQVYQWDTLSMDWIALFSATNTFDNADHLVESLSTLNYLGDPVLLKDVYLYDANGDNNIIESFLILDMDEYATGKQELTYQNHLPTEVVVFEPDENGIFLPSSKTTSTYTSFDREEQVKNYVWSLDTGDWIKIEGNTYTYDNEQRLSTKEKVLLNAAGTEERERTTYAYLEAENVALETYFGWDGNAFYLVDRTYYYYSGAVTATPEPVHLALPLIISPTPTVGAARLNLNSPALIQIYNSTGNLMRSLEYQPEQSIPFTDLPHGLYFITAHSTNELYSGKLVKQ